MLNTRKQIYAERVLSVQNLAKLSGKHCGQCLISSCTRYISLPLLKQIRFELLMREFLR